MFAVLMNVEVWIVEAGSSSWDRSWGTDNRL